MEEGLSPSPPLTEQLADRSRFPALIDLEVSARLHADRFVATNDPPIQPTWNVMVRKLLALDGIAASAAIGKSEHCRHH
jgi:hypothetical protein